MFILRQSEPPISSEHYTDFPPMASPFICPRLLLVAFRVDHLGAGLAYRPFAPVQSRFHDGQFLVRDAVGMWRCRRVLLALGIRHGKQRLSRSRHCWMRSCADLENPTAQPRPRRAPKGSAPPASRFNERRLRPSPTCSPPAIGGRSVPPWGFPPDRRGTLLAANRVRTARVGVRHRFASGFARGLAVRLASSQSAFQAQLGPPIRVETLFALKHSWGSEPTGLPYAITLPTP
jgi:hypothetical protein